MARKKIEIPRSLLGATMDGLIHAGFDVVPDLRGGGVEGVYCVAEMPEGWDLRPGERGSHAHHILDAQGRLRGVLVHRMDYASRFRDHRSMTMLCRFAVDPVAFHRAPGYRQVVVKDTTGEVLYLAGRYPRTDLTAQNARVLLAEKWLSERFPRWQDPMSHWDDATVPAAKEKHTSGASA
jgi:hypothetical protein